ncbi:glycine receptor subunit alpha-2-like protein [Dinothrombium tinctorium]|uniref:Glycine receptor subunit alpha-2-like protein n=1 Tax=Dinothrombium tinctorium TaxID=1965070 RepID=A0A443R5P8_9ACAR|nr:glycine receptor subunit alpha-2-like protein [Dinothrombium tinctorium]
MPSSVVQTEKLEVSQREEDDVCVILYRKRLAGTIACVMDLREYPIDQSIAVSNTDERVNYIWEDFTIHENAEASLLEHEMSEQKEIVTESLLGNSNLTFNYTKNFSILILTIKFRRNIANKFAGVYFPTIILVFTSFSTFWYGVDTTPERTTVGSSVILALVTMFGEVRVSLPPTQYINEIDKWMVASMLFVTLSMIEATVVDYIYDKNRLIVSQRQKIKKEVQVYSSPLKKWRKLSVNYKKAEERFWRLFQVKVNRDMPEYWPLQISTKIIQVRL